LLRVVIIEDALLDADGLKLGAWIESDLIVLSPRLSMRISGAWRKPAVAAYPDQIVLIDPSPPLMPIASDEHETVFVDW